MIGREGMHRAVLLEIVGQSGGAHPRSYISTGNVTFSAEPYDISRIVDRVERAITAVLGRTEPFFVRSVAHLEDLVASDPFSGSPFPDAVEHVVSFLHAPIDPKALHLPTYSRRGDICLFSATRWEVFGVARMVDGRTSGPGGLVERTLDQRVTSRAWGTVVRVATDPDPLPT